MTECPAGILARTTAWGLAAEDVAHCYPAYARVFNATTVAQALAVAALARRESPITLRGVFYRAVSLGVYPDTGDAYYRQCGNIVLKLRRAWLLDYAAIVDSTRRLKPSSWSGLADYTETVAKAYRKDLWARQPVYLEFFVEKDAMAAVIEPVTAAYDVHLNVIRGNCSETFVYQIAELWREIEKPIFAYYLGDHDPAGLLIERDLRDRLEAMLEEQEVPWLPGASITWQRLAITEEDFRRPDILGFPVKGNRASRAWRTRNGEYLRRHGDRCVEVDALPPAEIRRRIRATIEGHIDREEWSRLQAMEALERQSVQEFALAQRTAAGGLSA